MKFDDIAQEKMSVFITGEYEQAEELNEFLKNKCGLNCKLDWFIGYRTIVVSKKDYPKAVTYGTLYAIKNDLEEISWVSPYSMRMHNLDDVAKLALKRVKEKTLLSHEDLMNFGCNSEYSTGTVKKSDFDGLVL